MVIHRRLIMKHWYQILIKVKPSKRFCWIIQVQPFWKYKQWKHTMIAWLWTPLKLSFWKMYNCGVIILKSNWLSNSELLLLSCQKNLLHFQTFKFLESLKAYNNLFVVTVVVIYTNILFWVIKTINEPSHETTLNFKTCIRENN